MLEPRAATGNVASRAQVDRAERIEKRRQLLDDQDFTALLDLPSGRRFLWRLLAHCKTFESIFDGHGSKMSHNSGMQDVGHFVLGEIQRVRPEAFQQMQQDVKLREQTDA
ncbi:MAG TPA: hypothetical protein VJZ25_07055 [Gemmatimonadaceae bacterium]|nr:hypothetical protein [Gemmatimonadaceae bacterium]